jgi:PAS domain S-box-containing protein
MGDDSEDRPDNRDWVLGPDDDSMLEPEVVRWLRMYAEAVEGCGDATVAAILDEMNRLLGRYRRESAVHRADYGSRLRTLTEQMPVMLWTTDAELRVTTFAGGGLSAVGIDPLSTVSLPLAVVLGTDTPSSTAVDAHQRALHGRPAVYEYARRARFYLAHVQPLSNPEGVVVGTIGLAIDVTEGKQTAEALRQSEERFRIALRGSTVIVFSQDAELRHTWIYNPVPGFTPESVIGKTDEEIHGPEDAAILTAIKRRVLQTGVETRQEVRLAPNGEARYYDLAIEPVRGPAGEIIGITGAATDVTERKQAEEALARREQQLADAQGLAEVGSWEFDFAINRLSWSAEEHRIFGLNPELGPPSRETVLARVHPDDRERSRAVWETAIRTGKPYAWDCRIVRPDGEIRVIHSRGALVRDATGRPARMAGTSQDVTELRQAGEAVRATKQMLEHLLECFPNGALCVLDTELRYVMASGRGLAQVGLTPEQMIDKLLAEVHPPEVAAAREGPYRRALAGETVTVEVPFAGRIYTLSVAPLDREDEAVRTIIAVAQDITERVRAERDLARREAQLAEAQRLAHVGSWERDIATGRQTWSTNSTASSAWSRRRSPPHSRHTWNSCTRTTPRGCGRSTRPPSAPAGRSSTRPASCAPTARCATTTAGARSWPTPPAVPVGSSAPSRTPPSACEPRRSGRCSGNVRRAWTACCSRPASLLPVPRLASPRRQARSTGSSPTRARRHRCAKRSTPRRPVCWRQRGRLQSWSA